MENSTEHLNTEEGAMHNDKTPHGTKAIWITFWKLFGLTIIDIGFYFTLPPSGWRNILFVGLGILKAYYIVGIFMHMSYEVKRLMSVIILPFMLVLGLIAALLYEGGSLMPLKW